MWKKDRNKIDKKERKKNDELILWKKAIEITSKF